MYKLLKYILIVAVSFLLLCLMSYLTVPVYDFTDGKPFVGDSLYNPYRGVVEGNWIKANFHAHQKEKPRCDYTVAEYVEAYYRNGYDIAGITDHQYINREMNHRSGYISGYEHGYGVNGYHQLVLGAQHVTWREFPIMITQSQMQYMLQWLRPDAEILVLNHPAQTRLIDHDIYTRLRGYDLLEINPGTGDLSSLPHWDHALSSGIYSTLIGNDDAHYIDDRARWTQRCFTRLNVPNMRPATLLQALKAGHAYATYVPTPVNIQPHPHVGLPQMRSFDLHGDTLSLELDRPATEIRFIGQNGRLLYTDTGCMGTYKIAPRDTYVRSEAHFDNGVILYFNPVVRSASGERPENTFVPIINFPKTIGLHLVWILLIAGLTGLLLRLLGYQRRPLPTPHTVVVLRRMHQQRSLFQFFATNKSSSTES